MALITITYLPVAVVLSGVQLLETAVLLARRGQGSMRNLQFVVVEYGFGLISLWEVFDPRSPATQSVALAYLAYLAVAALGGYVILRRAGWRYSPSEVMAPFPLFLLLMNIFFVSAFFTYAVYCLLA